MAGFDHDNPRPTPAGRGGIWFPRGHILHDYLELRVMPRVDRPDRPRRPAIHRDVEGGAALHREAGEMGRGVGRDRRLCGAGLALQELPERMFAIADALNEEYHELADAGCPVIQIEEPQIHLLAVRNIQDAVINPKLMVEVFNRTVKGLRAKTEVWAHSRRGNPSQQRMFAQVQSYKPALEAYNTVDADVITFESSSSGGIDLEAIGKTITEKKISIGVIDHHTLQVEQPEQVAAQIRAALKHIPAERLMVSTDCGMGREGMSRRHAFYKRCRWCSAPTSCARSWACRRRGCSRPTSAIRWWCRQRSDRGCARTRFTSPPLCGERSANEGSRVRGGAQPLTRLALSGSPPSPRGSGARDLRHRRCMIAA